MALTAGLTWRWEESSLERAVCAAHCSLGTGTFLVSITGTQTNQQEHSCRGRFEAGTSTALHLQGGAGWRDVQNQEPGETGTMGRRDGVIFSWIRELNCL